MKTIEQATKVIYETLSYVYCDSCRGGNKKFINENPDYCDDCHRKYQSWGISESTANDLAKKILG